MKQQLYVISLLLTSSFAEDQTLKRHPVRQEIVDEILSKTSKWKPRQVNKNHFVKVPAKKMHHTLGSLDAGANSDDILDGSEMHLFRKTKE
jgi:hypothetical protein